MLASTILMIAYYICYDYIFDMYYELVKTRILPLLL